MVSKKILRMGAQKTLIQKTYKINVAQDSLNIDFYTHVDNFIDLNCQ